MTLSLIVMIMALLGYIAELWWLDRRFNRREPTIPWRDLRDVELTNRDGTRP